MLDNGGFGLAVELDVHAPALDQATAEALVAKAHEVCPYSNATRGNVDVTLTRRLTSRADRRVDQSCTDAGGRGPADRHGDLRSAATTREEACA